MPLKILIIDDEEASVIPVRDELSRVVWRKLRQSPVLNPP